MTLAYTEIGNAQLSIEGPISSLCNTSVEKSYVLNNSTSCDHVNGIIINNSNMNFDFNSSSLLGSGYLNPHTGILISNVSNITLHGDGRIGHFDTGVLINNSENVNVSNMNFTGNKVSIKVINSSDIFITNNYLYTNTAGIKFYNVNSSIISANSL